MTEQQACQSGKAPESGPVEQADPATEALVSDPVTTPVGVETRFDQRVACATWQSVRSVRRLRRIGSAFDNGRLGVFTETGTPQTDTPTIAKIKDAARRAKVVDLIAKKTKPWDAITQVMGTKAPARDDGRSQDKLAASADTAHPEAARRRS